MAILFSRVRACFCRLVWCSVPSLTVSAATLHVATNSPSPAPPYASWSTAAHTLQDAVDAAQAGDTVLVSDGVYATGGRALSDSITNRVAIDKAITVQSVSGPQVTLIDGADASRCAYVGNGALLNGFTLTRGVAGGAGQGEGGGAWSASAGIVSNCLFRGNSAYYGGGASGGTLYNCSLIANWAFLSGGGAISSTLFGCILSNNTASVTGGGADSGALYNCSVLENEARGGGGAFDCVLSNCLVAANIGDRTGGGVSGGTLFNCTLTGNSASDVAGGGSFVSTLYNCVLSDNSSEDGGGASGGALYGCTLTGNHCGRNGGGADFATLYNCTLIGNLASSPGGGVFGCVLYNCVLAQNASGGSGGGAVGSTLYNCTLASNSAEFFAGGVLSCVLTNCISFYNTAPNGANYTSSTINFSCTTPLPANGIGNIAQEPGFADLPGGDYHLLFGSPCINAGINLDWMIGATDLDGNPRISGGVVDMGAYEFPLSATAFITGGGWLNSPPGSLNPGLSSWAGVASKAAFNLVAKSSTPGKIPAGRTDFRLGKLYFSSTGLDLLLVAGAQTQLIGGGTINGQGAFGFILRATDGKVNGGGGLDRFRIKIWDQGTGTIVYDNQSGTPDTAGLGNPTILQGGNIVIHKP